MSQQLYQLPANTMNPPVEALFARLLEEMDGRESAEWDATESQVDAKVYSDPDIYRLEIDRIFRRVPLCLEIGRAHV